MKKRLGVSLILLISLHSHVLLWAESIEFSIAAEQPLSGSVVHEFFPSSTSANTGLDVSQENVSGIVESRISTEELILPTLMASEQTNLLIDTDVDLFTGQALLVLSEIFFDGSDEWFEISNIGSGTFLGPLLVKGVKSTDLVLSSVSIPAGGSFVWGDTMAQIIDRTIIHSSALGLSISDSNALNVSLYSSGQLLDIFSVDTSVVSALPNNYGFEKLRSGALLTISSTQTDRVVNISGSWIANPGQIMTYQPIAQLPSTGSSLPPLTGDIPTSSGALLTGGTPDNSGIVISEIHPTNDLLPEYLELFFEKPFSGSLAIQGLGSSNSTKTLTLHVHAGQYVVIAETLSGFTDTSMVVLADTISLTDGGEILTIVDLTGQIYTSVQYTGSSSGRSWYLTSGGFSSKDFPTPGFSEKALTYFSVPLVSLTTKSTIENSYYQGLYKKRKDRYYDLKAQISSFGLSVNKSGKAYKKANAGEIELMNGVEEVDGEVMSSLSSEVKIVAVLADENGKDDQSEQVSIELVSGDPVDLSSFVIHAGTKKTALGGLLQSPGDKQTIKATFGFTNKPTCISLEHNTIVYDTFCYGQPQAGVRIGLSGNIADDVSLSGLTDFSWMKKLSFVVQTGQVCALFGETLFSCQHLSPVMDAKKRASYQKKIDSIQKKLDKKITQYKTLQERYNTTKINLDAKWRKYYQQVKSLRADYKAKLSSSQLEAKIRKNYDKTIQNYLKKNRTMVWQNPDIIALQELLTANISALKETPMDRTVLVDGYSFTVGDLNKQFAFKTDPSVFIDYFVGKSLAFFSSGWANKRNTWVDQRYMKPEQ